MTARFGTAAGGPHALVQIASCLAAAPTCLAYQGARAADNLAHVGATQQEVCGGLANLRAIEHQTKVLRLGVLAAQFQRGLRYRFQTGDVVVQALVNAMLYLLLIDEVSCQVYLLLAHKISFT